MAILAASCGEDTSQNQIASGPCPGEAGFGARLAAADGPVDVCVPDESVATVFTFDGWYNATARMKGDDGTVYEFQMMFPHRPTSRKLHITGNLAEALADPDGAWFYYLETPDSGDAIESALVTSGTFRLGYSDTKVVAGLFEGVELEMEAADSREPAGKRMVVEGFFSILTDESSANATH